ncbi:MAG: TetR/AcrR family transcriptional regulator [Eubacteriales bacterium]
MQKKIINNAKLLFKEFGYKKTTMQMIAIKTNISKSLLTYYYPKKSYVLTTITRGYLNKIHIFIEEQIEYDPLLIYMLTYEIFFINIFKDKNTKKFYREIMTRTDRGMNSYNNSDELYIPIINQFNSSLSQHEFNLKKFEIFGSHAELSHVYFNNIYKMTDEEFIDQTLMVTVTLLGISNFIYLSYKNKCKKLLDDLEFTKFQMLE